jgi:hypothetical protein
LLLLITYAPQPTSDVEDRTVVVQQLINEHAIAHIQPLPARWIVQTDEDIDTWVARLGPPGRLLIVRIQGRVNGWLPKEHWEWISARGD